MIETGGPTFGGNGHAWIETKGGEGLGGTQGSNSFVARVHTCRRVKHRKLKCMYRALKRTLISLDDDVVLASRAFDDQVLALKED
jgi:hypothetical protein